MQFTGLLWFAFLLVPLVYLQRLLHREIQIIFYLITRNKPLTIAIFSMIFFPGVFLHELSHFLMAKVLGVRTGKFSLLPKSLDTGHLQLGYVETEQTDILRDSLIGLAPIIAGTLFVAYAGVVQLRLDALWHVFSNGQVELFWMGLRLLPTVPDFYLWFYLTFAVSSTMLPSESDRHAWLPLGMWIGALLVLAVFSGAGVWMLNNLAPVFDPLLRSVALLFALSDIVHIVLLIPLYGIRQVMTYTMQLQVN
ncbi:MAG TPA: hypothetical protein PKJ84_04180 [Anaerolineales bacterium]|nr:hypothetical protein [Anaerolineales bacterium]HNE04080.1 hypothetical protein [Anaerolineales bacterium]HNO93342.1 hypothetical protein [Anaerolineales bacterium]